MDRRLAELREHAYGEKYREALKAFRLSKATLKNYASIAKTFEETSRRRDVLGWVPSNRWGLSTVRVEIDVSGAFSRARPGVLAGQTGSQRAKSRPPGTVLDL